MTNSSGQPPRTRRDLWEPWLLPVAATPLLGIALVSDGRHGMRAACAITAVLLLTAAVAAIAYERLRTGIVEMVVETAIGTTALVFLGWGLGLSRPIEPGPGRVAALIASAAAVSALAALVSLGWLASIDRGARRLALVLLGAAIAALAVGCAATAQAATSGTWPHWVADLGFTGAIVFGGVAVAHPSRRQLRMPALELERGHVARRAAVTLGAVLVGPILLVIPAAADTLSLPFVAAITVVLTSLAVAHVYRLLQRWGALEHDVFHDGLTGLPNRQFFNQRLHLAIEHARSDDTELAVLFLDLDHFKQVNDNLGHATGNLLLVTVAARLRAAADEGMTVARLGGDEFAVLVPLPRGPRRDARREAADHRGVLDAVRRGNAAALHHAEHRRRPLPGGRARGVRAPRARRRRDVSGEGPSARDAQRPGPTAADRTDGRHRAGASPGHQRRPPAVALPTQGRSAVGPRVGRRGPAALAPPLRRVAPAGFVPPHRGGERDDAGDHRMGAARSMCAEPPVARPRCGRHPRRGEPPAESVRSQAPAGARGTRPPVHEAAAGAPGARDQRAGDVARSRHAPPRPQRAPRARRALRDRRLRRRRKPRLPRTHRGRRARARSSPCAGARARRRAVVTAVLAMGRSLGIETRVEGVETAEQLAFVRASGAHAVQGYLLAPPAPSEEIEPLLTGLLLDLGIDRAS